MKKRRRLKEDENIEFFFLEVDILEDWVKMEEVYR